jgi:hypothetical protein
LALAGFAVAFLPVLRFLAPAADFAVALEVRFAGCFFRTDMNAGCVVRRQLR